MKKCFTTGLIILLPVALTFLIAIFFFNLLTNPFLHFVKSFFDQYQILGNGWLFFSPELIQDVVAKLLILLSLIGLTVLLGWVARWFFVRAVLRLGDALVRKIPLVKSVYKTSQEVVRTVFNQDAKAFNQVVLVHFPSPSSYALGLITREEVPHLGTDQVVNSVAVFVPTTPNPTSGFLILYKKEDVFPVEMRVEDAFKFIISCGVIQPSVAGEKGSISHMESAS